MGNLRLVVQYQVTTYNRWELPFERASTVIIYSMDYVVEPNIWIIYMFYAS